MRAADFYGTVRRELGPRMKACGFRRASTDPDLGLYPRAGMWIKPLPDAGPPPAPLRLIVSFEVSKRGWIPGTGGEFRIQLEAGASAQLQTLLDDDQWQALTSLVGSIVQRIRHRPDASCLWEGRTHSLFNRKIIRFHPYWDDDDIRAYLRLMTPWLPDMIGTLGGDQTLATHLDPLQVTSSQKRAPSNVKPGKGE